MWQLVGIHNRIQSEARDISKSISRHSIRQSWLGEMADMVNEDMRQVDGKWIWQIEFGCAHDDKNQTLDGRRTWFATVDGVYYLVRVILV